MRRLIERKIWGDWVAFQQNPLVKVFFFLELYRFLHHKPYPPHVTQVGPLEGEPGPTFGTQKHTNSPKLQQPPTRLIWNRVQLIWGPTK